MIWELEALIAHLTTLISCAGEDGCPVIDFVDLMNSGSHLLENISPKRVGVSTLKDATAGLSLQATETVWRWLAERDGISIGPPKLNNYLSPEDALEQEETVIQGHPSLREAGIASSRQVLQDVLSNPQLQMSQRKIFVSEKTMWESITGHSVDYKRVPRSEWLLLLGIASTRDHGILQGDLGRLVEQDKRSVPKRTDALVKKGYITKRTTLVRGTKTSKLWLKSLAPPLPRDGIATAEKVAEIDLSHDILVSNLDPVSWHTRWTGESVDYTALATTIMALCKEWDVMRIQDMKAKLGVLGMRWQMKVVSKVCRFLNARDAIRYVAAKLDNKIFKDCVRFNKELSNKDWSIFLATGKRPGKTIRPIELGPINAGEGDNLIGSICFRAMPPWCMDRPLHSSIVDAICIFWQMGLTNPDVYGITLGSSFTRFLSSMTTTMATPNIQPNLLKHLQLRSHHSRIGKVASYRYSIEPNSCSTSSIRESVNSVPESRLKCLKRSKNNYWFSPKPFTLRSARLETLANLRANINKQRGRPKRLHSYSKGDTRVRFLENLGSLDREELDKQKSRSGEQPLLSTLTSKGPLREFEAKGVPDETLQVEILRDEEPCGKQVSINHFTITQQSGNEDKTGAFLEETPRLTTELLSSSINQGAIADPTGRGRRRGRASRNRRGRHTGKQSSGEVTSGKLWICEQCGGSWKNDVGLKYHLEKSQTLCNPSFSSSVLKASQREKKSQQRSSSYTFRNVSISEGGSYASVGEHHNATNRDASPSSKTKRSERFEVSRREYGSETVHRSTELEKLDASARKMSLRQTLHKTITPCSLDLSQSSPVIIKINPSQTRQAGRPSSPAFTPNTRTGYDLKQPTYESFHTAPAVERVMRHTQNAMSGLPRSISSYASHPGRNNCDNKEIFTSGLELCHPVRGDMDALLTKSTPTKISKQKVRDENTERISSVLLAMLLEQNGVLAGGESLWRAFATVWESKFSGSSTLKLKDLQLALSRLLKKRVVLEHWHGFQCSNGLFSKCQIITLPHLNACSPDSLHVVEMIKHCHPRIYEHPRYLRADFDAHLQERKDVRRGRRLLSGEVAELDAPVYAAQMAAKRGPENQLYSRRSRKRRRHAVIPLAEAGRTPSHPEAQGTNLRWLSEAWEFGNSDICTISKPACNHPSPSVRIEFLEPNTFLECDVSNLKINSGGNRALETQPIKKQNLEVDLRLLDATIVPQEMVSFQAAQSVRGCSGYWPYLGTKFFEAGHASSYTMAGWMPDQAWFTWEAMAQNIDKRTGMLQANRRSSKSLPNAVLEKLDHCLSQELTSLDQFVNAPPLAAGPYNIFLVFPAGPTKSISTTNFVWPLKEQLTPELMRTALQEADWGVSSSDRESLVDVTPTGAKTLKFSVPMSLTAIQYHKVKRVALVTRPLTRISQISTARHSDEQVSNPIESPSYDEVDVLAAFAVIPALLGGADKVIDWGLLLSIFPTLKIDELRRFWAVRCKEKESYLKNFTRIFREGFIEALEKDELPMIDFENPLSYDWWGLIRWITRASRQGEFHLPKNAELHDAPFGFEETKKSEEDWREKYFHVQSSIHSRFEVITSTPGACPIDIDVIQKEDGHDDQKFYIAKSWIKSLCCTEESAYSIKHIKQRFLQLGDSNAAKSASLLRDAIDELTRQRIIRRSKKPPLGGRPYRLSEWYVSNLNKLAQRCKYDEAAAFKAAMDVAFRRRKALEIPYAINDGATMALTNLSASGRIKFLPVGIPNIPMGFEPGNYESRKYPKSYYHFQLQVIPTEIYQYNEDIKVLQAVARGGLPLISSSGEIPQWVDFSGNSCVQRWSEIAGALCFACATRGPMAIDGICSALKPILQKFEALLILEWGQRTGVLVKSDMHLGITVAEWWWLAIPWQLEASRQNNRNTKDRRPQNMD